MSDYSVDMRAISRTSDHLRHLLPVKETKADNKTLKKWLCVHIIIATPVPDSVQLRTSSNVSRIDQVSISPISSY